MAVVVTVVVAERVTELVTVLDTLELLVDVTVDVSVVDGVVTVQLWNCPAWYVPVMLFSKSAVASHCALVPVAPVADRE